MGSKTIWIARRELASFFTTWTGYVVAAIALFIDGLLFNAYAIGDRPKFSADVLGDFFYLASGIAMVAGILLAMRLIAEERQVGTDVLFYTSPVSERQLVYGKFLSALVFFGFITVLSLYMPALIMVHGKVSLGHVAAGYLGVFLLGAMTISIALFASSIAPNQLVAAVSGAAIVVLMLVLWMLADISTPPFKEIFSYTAMHNVHFNPFRRGLVHTQDIVYYLTATFFFLECAVRAVESRRWNGS